MTHTTRPQHHSHASTSTTSAIPCWKPCILLISGKQASSGIPVARHPNQCCYVIKPHDLQWAQKPLQCLTYNPWPEASSHDWSCVSCVSAQQSTGKPSVCLFCQHCHRHFTSYIYFLPFCITWSWDTSHDAWDISTISRYKDVTHSDWLEHRRVDG